MGIGDELMAAGEACRHRETYGCGPVVITDRMGRQRNHEIFRFSPDVAQPGEDGEKLMNCGKARPYIDWPASTPQRWAFKPYKPYPARLVIPHEIRLWAAQFAGCVAVEPNIKPGASPNKDWGWWNWQGLVSACPVPWLQIGQAGARRLSGVRFVECPSFIHAAAVLATVRLAVLPEGGLHHAAAAVGCRAVVIFGGYVSPDNTGYDGHINLFTGGEPCGNRLACVHCRSAMKAITVETVLDAMEKAGI